MDKSDGMSRRQARQTSDGNQTERKSFRSLICDESGIIIGEMVYRCLICSFISESMDKVRQHYQTEHVDIEDISNGEFRYINGDYCPSPDNSYLDEPASQPVDEPEPEEPVRTTGVNGGGSYGAKNRSGYITCRICSSTRFYSYVQRRYGQYTCSACYRHFREFLIKPKVYSCPNLGSCSMDAKNKCRACWLLACINVYSGNVGEDKQPILETYKPVKKQEYDDDDEEVDGDEEEDKEIIDKEDAGEGEDMGDKESGDFIDNDQGDKDESENEMTTIKPMRSQIQDPDGEPGSPDDDPIDPDTATAPASNVKRNLSNKVHKIFKKVNSKRKRNWSCMKCTNCLKQECGKCIYCLDRPKYGGQFRLRQRCANRRCLLKLKDL